MRIAVLGTGMVGRTLAGAFMGLGHDVVVGTRDPAATRARADESADALAGLDLRSFREAAESAELLVNATNGSGSISALEAAGEDNLAGRIILDVANPLDFSQGFPPSLSVCNTDSLAEQIQRRFPEAHVVKSLNTVTAPVMVDPGSLASPSTIFMCGDTDDAKDVVAGLLRELGWSDILDLGGIANARGPEMYLPLWLRVMGASGTARFNVRVIRE